MSVVLLLGIGVVGGLGAMARFTLDGAVSQRVGRGFPFGTLAVNLSGAFALGVLVGATLSDSAFKLIGTGLVGAFTTFSTWALESHRLGEDRRSALASVNFAASLLLGVLLAWIGRELGGAL